MHINKSTTARNPIKWIKDSGYTSKKRLRFLRWFHHFLGHQTRHSEEEKKRGISILMDFIVFLFSLPRTKGTWIWILCSDEDDEWVKALLNNEYAMPAFLPCHMNHPLSSKTNEKYIEFVICVLKHWRIFFDFISYCFTFLPFKFVSSGIHVARARLWRRIIDDTKFDVMAWAVKISEIISRRAGHKYFSERFVWVTWSKTRYFCETSTCATAKFTCQPPGSVAEQKGQRHTIKCIQLTSVRLISENSSVIRNVNKDARHGINDNPPTRHYKQSTCC